MSLDISVLRISRLGPIKNEILVYSLVSGTLLLYFGKRGEATIHLILMFGGLAMYFAGPSFWLYAKLRLQASHQEQAVLDNIRGIVDEDRVLRNHDTSQEIHEKNRGDRQ